MDTSRFQSPTGRWPADDLDTRIDIAFGNLESGGLVRGFEPTLHASRGYDLTKLLDLFEPVRDRPPALIGLCEGKEWDFHARSGGSASVNALARFLGRPYVIEYGHLGRGPSGPVVMYDPTVLRVDLFHQHGGVGVWDDNINISVFHHAANPEAKLWFRVEHWDFVDGDRRLAEAKRNNVLGDLAVPVVHVADNNSSASGDHLPQPDWDTVSRRHRAHKAWQPGGPGTPWVTDARALEHLVGRWVPNAQHPHGGERIDGMGFHAACEIAHFQHGMPAAGAFEVTVNREPGDQDATLINDWALLNDAAAKLMIPGTYRVYVPTGRPPSDHRLVSLGLAL